MSKIKLKGFTVLELLIVLVISSVVISLSVYVYTNIQKIVFAKSEKASYYQEIMNKLNKFDHDFKKASIVKKDDDKILLLKYNSQIVTYNLEQFFTSYNGTNDSISVSNLKYSFVDVNEKAINGIAFNITGHNHDTLRIKFFKSYSQDYNINQLNK